MVVPPYPYTLPYEITSGKNLTLWMEVSDLIENLESSELGVQDIQHIYFQTASGKQYRRRIGKKDLAKLLELKSQSPTVS